MLWILASLALALSLLNCWRVRKLAEWMRFAHRTWKDQAKAQELAISGCTGHYELSAEALAEMGERVAALEARSRHRDYVESRKKGERP